jgi:NAD(P)-dependent dehydrogenase (short-subunit alcohol dehydrogenase family)
MRFSNRAVIVTGASKGIGAGCAKVFAAEGAMVAIADIDAETGVPLAAELSESTPGRALFVPCDVRQAGEIQGAVDRCVDAFGRLDCLINNAGVHPPATSIQDTSIDDLEAVMRVNFTSTYLGAKYAIPHLLKTRGTIVNIRSMCAVLGQGHSTAYAATKGAQLSFTKSLAIELGAAGVRVNAVLPSNVDTPLMRSWAQTLDDPETALKRIAALQTIGRMATPEEIGRVCLFLATEDSSFITGQGIEVDGGASLDY